MTHEERNAELFGILRRAVDAAEESGRGPEHVAAAVRAAAGFARFHFPGTLADARLDRALHRIGTGRLPPWEPAAPAGPVARVLHVATVLKPTGGHSRVVLNWIARDRGRAHFVALTDQRPKAEVARAVEDAGARMPILSLREAGEGVVPRAARLREFVARERIDAVVLHVDPHEVVAPVALAGSPVPVAFFDHGDHAFSLGRLLSDLVVTFRDVAAWHAAGHPRALVLPLPVQPPREGAEPWAHPEPDGPVLLSMAAAYKYTPMGGHDFFASAGRILDAVPEAACYLVGVDDAAARRLSGGRVHPRLHPVGRVPNPAEYLRRAAYFLEPFPSGTVLGTLDAVAAGAVPIFNYVAINVFGVSARSVLPEALRRALPGYATAAEYEAWVAGELRSGEYRREMGPRIRDFVRRSSADGWTEYLDGVYERLRQLRGRPLDEDDVREREAHAAAFAGRSRWAEFRGDPMPRFLSVARHVVSPRDRLTILSHQAASIRRRALPAAAVDVARLVRVLAGR